MEPLPESLEVLRQLEADTGEELVEPIRRVSRTLSDLVPSCLGFSLSYVHQGIAVTFLATDPQLALLDGVQYAVGGPCVDAIDTGDAISLDDVTDPLDERLWELFGQAATAHGVRSTLSFPLHEQADVVGGVNVYAADRRAFAGVSDQVAVMFGAWAGEAVHNADLTWQTRVDARHGVERLEDASAVERAVGVLHVSEDLTLDAARERIHQAALRADITPSEVARAIIALQGVPPDDRS